MNIHKFFVSTAVSLALCGTALAQSNSDRFLLPQPDQPFEGKVDTRIGPLDFSNQYPSKASMETLLDSMDFHGATQAYLWALPLVSFANIQYSNDVIIKARQGEMVDFPALKEKLGILTANSTTPYIIGTADLSKTGPLVIEMPAGATAGISITKGPVLLRSAVPMM